MGVAASQADALLKQFRQQADRALRLHSARTNPNPFAAQPEFAERGSENNRMMALQRALLAAIRTRAVIRLPLHDLNVGQNLLNTTGYLLGLGKREPQSGATQSIPIYPDNLMHDLLFTDVVEKDDLN